MVIEGNLNCCFREFLNINLSFSICTALSTDFSLNSFESLINLAVQFFLYECCSDRGWMLFLLIWEWASTITEISAAHQRNIMAFKKWNQNKKCSNYGFVLISNKDEEIILMYFQLLTPHTSVQISPHYLNPMFYSSEKSQATLNENMWALFHFNATILFSTVVFSPTEGHLYP